MIINVRNGTNSLRGNTKHICIITKGITNKHMAEIAARRRLFLRGWSARPKREHSEGHPAAARRQVLWPGVSHHCPRPVSARLPRSREVSDRQNGVCFVDTLQPHRGTQAEARNQHQPQSTSHRQTMAKEKLLFPQKTRSRSSRPEGDRSPCALSTRAAVGRGLRKPPSPFPAAYPRLL